MRSGETAACYRLAWENLVRFQNVSLGQSRLVCGLASQCDEHTRHFTRQRGEKMTEETQLSAEKQAAIDALMQSPLLQSNDAQSALQQLQADFDVLVLWEGMKEPPR